MAARQLRDGTRAADCEATLQDVPAAGLWALDSLAIARDIMALSPKRDKKQQLESRHSGSEPKVEAKLRFPEIGCTYLSRATPPP